MTERETPCQTTAAEADDARFVQRVKQELDRSCSALDGATQSRLNSMRHAALARGQRQHGLPAWLPFGGLATACVLVLTVLLQPSIQQQAPQSGTGTADAAAPIEDLDLLAAVEELDLYEEYEFYQWLATSDAGY